MSTRNHTEIVWLMWSEWRRAERQEMGETLQETDQCWPLRRRGGAYTHGGTLLSQKASGNWAICAEADGLELLCRVKYVKKRRANIIYQHVCGI